MWVWDRDHSVDQFWIRRAITDSYDAKQAKHYVRRAHGRYLIMVRSETLDRDWFYNASDDERLNVLLREIMEFWQSNAIEDVECFSTSGSGARPIVDLISEERKRLGAAALRAAAND
jgi:hypothetical protein